MNMDRHWYKVSVLYDCLINRKDIMNVAEYVESDIDTLFEDYDDNEDNEEESDIDLLSYSSDSYDETDDMEISTREFVPVTLEF
jgi:hypothetical protein